VEELRELNRRQAQFLDVTSHELRTPLTSIVGYVKTLLQPGFRDDAATREEFLRAIERQTDHLGSSSRTSWPLPSWATAKLRRAARLCGRSPRP
jgi:signal transduction histidine kinase